MMRLTPEEQFWNSYLRTLPEVHAHRALSAPSAWSFGSDPNTANNLAALVVKGIKTATCSRYLGHNIMEEAGPSIILNSEGKPRCVIDTFEIAIRRFDEIDSKFAFDEGEGDQSLEYWREEHWEFFTQESKTEGYEVSKDMLLCCERFRLLYRNLENEKHIKAG